MLYIAFKHYLVWCDKSELDALTEQGYRGFVGNAGELRRLITLAKKPLPYLFMYEDGQEKGISESTASTKVTWLKQALEYCGVYQSNWHSGIDEFIKESNPTKPYSEHELKLTLRRLQYYFFSLSSQLIEHKRKNPTLPPPDSLIVILDKTDNGHVIEIEVKQSARGVSNSHSVHIGTPFNRAMQAAYYLFAYYTSFNTTSILDVRLPIDVVGARKEGRTLKHVTVRGFKGRSNKIVAGLFSDYDTDSIPKADNGSGAGYITAELDKKDGLTFIKALSELSHSYSKNPYQHIIYQLDNSNEPKLAGQYITRSKLSEELGLYADFTKGLSLFLVDAYFLALERNLRLNISLPNATGFGHTVSKTKTLFIGAQAKKLYLTNVAYAAIRSMSNIDLKNIIIPLTYSDVGLDGKITVSFEYENGEHGQFSIEFKYKRFFESLESYASYYTPTSRSKNHPYMALKPPYLIPLGTRRYTKQWDGLEFTKASYLSSLGIRSGDYFLDLGTKRFRSTTSNNHFDPNDSGYSVSKHILQNTIKTLQTHYIDGHPNQNKVIASQAIQVLEEWAKSSDIVDAKTIVRERLDIPVLEYDTWKKLRMPTNLNGVLCDGQPDVTAQKKHRESKYLSKKLLDTEHGGISCYQFDMCVYCKSAKLVDDVHSVYKFLSFIELLEDAADRMPNRINELTDKASYFRKIAEQNISLDVLHDAEDKLFDEGRYFLHDDEFIDSMRALENA
jgi:hypothetical protein